MIYIIDHYYFYENKKGCLVIKSDKSIEEIIEICASVEFLFEDVVDVEESLDFECLLKILTRYYGIKDIKEFFLDNLSKIHLPTGMVAENVGNFSYYDEDNNNTVTSATVVIDLYGARESQCRHYSSIMEKWLPKGKDLEDIKTLLVEEGKEI